MTSSNVTLVAPVKGVVVPLADVPDPVFAEGTLGQGIALDPLGGCLHAPCAGEVIQCARTHNAFTIKSDEGVEVVVTRWQCDALRREQSSDPVGGERA